MFNAAEELSFKPVGEVQETEVYIENSKSIKYVVPAMQSDSGFFAFAVVDHKLLFLIEDDGLWTSKTQIYSLEQLIDTHKDLCTFTKDNKHLVEYPFFRSGSIDVSNDDKSIKLVIGNCIQKVIMPLVCEIKDLVDRTIKAVERSETDFDSYLREIYRYNNG